MDKFKTDVIFRRDKKDDSEVYALFPHQVDHPKGLVTCFVPMEGHMSVDYDYCIKTSIPATDIEYQETFNTLTNHYGYNLNVIKKRNYDKYLLAYDHVWGSIKASNK